LICLLFSSAFWRLSGWKYSKRVSRIA
jgi:hypothetical protein